MWTEWGSKMHTQQRQLQTVLFDRAIAGLAGKIEGLVAVA